MHGPRNAKYCVIIEIRLEMFWLFGRNYQLYVYIFCSQKELHFFCVCCDIKLQIVHNH